MSVKRLRLVAYLRVSTVEQAKHGYGLDSQRAAITAAANSMKARIVLRTVDEGLSGALPAVEHPGLSQAMTAMRLGEADGLVVRDLDRSTHAVTVQEGVLAEVWSKNTASVFTSVPAQEVRRDDLDDLDDPDDPVRTAMREMGAVFAGLERRMTAKRLVQPSPSARP